MEMIHKINVEEKLQVARVLCYLKVKVNYYYTIENLRTIYSTANYSIQSKVSHCLN